MNSCNLLLVFQLFLFRQTRNIGIIKTAYSLLLQDEYTSQFYVVNHGATTIWERWDGIKDDGTFWSADMNAQNHYAYVAVVDGLYSVEAGIQSVEENAGLTKFKAKKGVTAEHKVESRGMRIGCPLWTVN